jgi:hypothetical protein
VLAAVAAAVAGAGTLSWGFRKLEHDMAGLKTEMKTVQTEIVRALTDFKADVRARETSVDSRLNASEIVVHNRIDRLTSQSKTDVASAGDDRR